VIFSANYLNKSREKNIDIGLFDATNNLITSYKSYNTALQLYEYEKVLLPLMIYENYYKIMFDNAFGCSNLKIFDIMRKLTDSISIGDVIETNIYTDQNWYLQNIHGFYTCVYTSWLLNNSLKNKTNQPSYHKLEFSSDLNKTSLKNINRKNIITLQQYLPNKSLDDLMYLNKMLYNLMNRTDYSLVVKIIKEYKLNFKLLETILKIDKIVTKLILNPKLKKQFN
jgi:hypothetical protein